MPVPPSPRRTPSERRASRVIQPARPQTSTTASRSIIAGNGRPSPERGGCIRCPGPGWLVKLASTSKSCGSRWKRGNTVMHQRALRHAYEEAGINASRPSAHSPLFQARGVTMPTLIQHGERDERLPLSQGAGVLPIAAARLADRKTRVDFANRDNFHAGVQAAA